MFPVRRALTFFVAFVLAACGSSSSGGPTSTGSAAGGSGAAGANAATGSPPTGSCAAPAVGSCLRSKSGFGGPLCTDYLVDDPENAKDCAAHTGTYSATACDRTGSVGGCCRDDAIAQGERTIDWLYPPVSDLPTSMALCSASSGDEWVTPE